jgi:formylglycine-generating enzyme required for sulfatase activity
MTADHLEQLGHPDPHRGAQKFLQYTDVRAGLLQASDAGDAYAFPHLTFQEYLAGLELVSGVGVVARIMAHHADDRWRLPILLGVGDHVSGAKLEMPFQLLRELLDAEERDPARRQRDLLFAAEIAADVGWDRLEQGGATFKKLRRDLAQELADVVAGSTLPAAERVRAGALLGELGDPRNGGCDLPPALARIDGGTFTIGEPREQAQYPIEANDASLTLPTFEIARYPITNAQYALFMADDAYNASKPWWDNAGRAWLTRDDQAAEGLESWQRRELKDRPEFWDNARYGLARANHPVVGVSWYEAMAFCRWLTHHLVYNPDGYSYVLPSEAEWEYAARGVERRPYPWGPEQPDAERANFEQQNAGTTAVGCFSAGATPERVYDLAGNVWEWTRSAYTDYPYDPNDGRENPHDPVGKRFTLRGGGWSDLPLNLRASYRLHGAPGDHGSAVGFRLTRHLQV